jgi:hypothetical protein
LLIIKTLLCELLKIQIYTVFKSEGMEAAHEARVKTGRGRVVKIRCAAGGMGSGAWLS